MVCTLSIFKGSHLGRLQALDLCGQPQPLSALLHLGQLCLDSDENTRAKELFLLACRQQPSCTAWLGVGTACYELAQYAEVIQELVPSGCFCF